MVGRVPLTMCSLDGGLQRRGWGVFGSTLRVSTAPTRCKAIRHSGDRSYQEPKSQQKEAVLISSRLVLQGKLEI